jgi:hypothetical protein
MYKSTVRTAVGSPIIPAICADWAAGVHVIVSIDDVGSYAFVGVAGTSGAAMCERVT